MAPLQYERSAYEISKHQFISVLTKADNLIPHLLRCRCRGGYQRPKPYVIRSTPFYRKRSKIEPFRAADMIAAPTAALQRVRKSPNTHPSPRFQPLCPLIIHRIFPFVKSRRKEESIQFPGNALHFWGIWIIILCAYRLKSAS